MTDDLAGELRDLAGRWLPGHMIPSVIVELAELPRTTSGKLDRAALPVPDTVSPAAGAEPPADEREEAIAGVLAAVLDLPRVGAQDNFFRLGGTSVHVVRAIAGIAERLGVSVPPVRFFQDPTVRGLAAAVVREQGTS